MFATLHSLSGGEFVRAVDTCRSGGPEVKTHLFPWTMNLTLFVSLHPGV